MSFFSAGGVDFVVLSFEFDVSPGASLLAWADSVLAAHPTRWAIVNAPSVTGTGDPAPFSAQGQAIYDGLKHRPNLFLMLGGHEAGEGRRSDSFEGRRTWSLSSDYQDRANGGNGWLRILEFDPTMGELRIRTYSPSLDQWERDADSEFTLQIELLPGGTWEPIGTLSSVPSGTHATIAWSGLATLTEYEWYAEVSDAYRTVAGPVFRFTTGSGAPTSAPLAFLPPGFALRPLSQQPLRGRGIFGMALPREAHVSLELFDVAGRRLATLAEGVYPAGVHPVTWDGRTDQGRAAAGVYFLRYRTPDRDVVSKVVLIL